MVQGTSVLASMDEKLSTLWNHNITVGEPRTNDLGTTGGGTTTTLSQGTIMGEPSEGTLLNVHTIKDKP